MIAREELLDLAADFGLGANVVEKDYALGWLLAAVGEHAATRDSWLFKGGTCLKKCFFETYRFSEDLDFTLLDAAHLDERFLGKLFDELAEWNVVILRSLFLPFFFATSLAALILFVIGVFRLGSSGAVAMLVGGVLYVLGMFVVTMTRNVPLNNALQVAATSSAGSAEVWARYLREWTMWNHVRTVASTAACALFIAAL